MEALDGESILFLLQSISDEYNEQNLVEKTLDICFVGLEVSVCLSSLYSFGD